MINFDETVAKTQELVKKWDLYDETETVTIIRDVYGKIALLLEMKTENGREKTVPKQKKNELLQSLKTGLGSYCQNQIYYNKECDIDILKIMVQEIKQKRFPMEGKWYLLERGIAKKAWIDRNYEENAIWPYDEAKDGKKPKVVTFYSFKGGMGRTTALAATALCMAAKGKNILMIDTDVEAPGLASLFQNEENCRQPGVVDYLLERNLKDTPIPMEDYITQVGTSLFPGEIEGTLFLISSGNVQEDYLQKLARIDFQDTVPGKLKAHICQLICDAVLKVGQLGKTVDYVFLDARAGFHDMGGIVPTQIPHGVVVFGKDSRQSWEGTRQVIRAIGETQADQPGLIIVDSACGRDGYVTSEEKQSFIEKSYDICCENFYEDENQPAKDAKSMPHTPVFVPYQPILMRSVSLYTDGTTADEERIQAVKAALMREEYQQIAGRIAQWFGEGADSDE